MTLEVLQPGFITTVQDLGRTGCGRYGVPESGAIDRFALVAANQLVGNPEGVAGIEMAVEGLELYAWQDCLVALTGAGFSLQLNGKEMPIWMAVRVREGDDIQCVPDGSGTWGTLAVSGGVQVPEVMGSRSTYLRGGFGGLDGRVLAAGDILPTPVLSGSQSLMAGTSLSKQYRPRYAENPVVRVILGPQDEAFTARGIETFLHSAYLLSQTADRMGYRLEGEEIEHAGPADILSDGIPFGGVQVPVGGQPIVMMSDRQPTGGYTKIAVVIRADLPLLAQCRPGISKVRFRVVTIEEAQAAYRQQMLGLRNGIEEAGNMDFLSAEG